MNFPTKLWRTIARSAQQALFAALFTKAGLCGEGEKEIPIFSGRVSKLPLGFELLSSTGIGVSAFGANEAHDLWLVTGRVVVEVGGPLFPETAFAGKLELFGALSGGGQYEPDCAYYLGSNGGVRYVFQISPRWVPYLICQAGIAATDIGGPDLSGTFQFNEEGGIGLRYHLEPSRAIVVESTFKHISNGGISEPNDGVNAIVLSLGYYIRF